MAAAHRRHDMSGEVWEHLKPHLPGGEGKVGRPAQDNRRFIDAVCWILRTAPLVGICPRTTGTGRTPTAASPERSRRALAGPGRMGPPFGKLRSWMP